MDETRRQGEDDSKKKKKKKKHSKKSKKHSRSRGERERKRHKKSSRGYDSSSSSLSFSRKSKKKRKKEESNKKHDLTRNYELADALLELFSVDLNFSQELPNLLIRLVTGTSFNLVQMPNPALAHALRNVLVCLEPFGVLQQQDGPWIWKNPSSGARGDKGNELILIKVIHSLLSEIGIHVEAFEQYKQETLKQQQKVLQEQQVLQEQDANNQQQQQEHSLQKATRDFLCQFDKNGSSLAQELIDMFQLVLEGETIDLNGLEHVKLRNALQHLMESIGLQQYQMETKQEEETTTLGYGLAENENDDEASPQEHDTIVRNNIDVVLKECQHVKGTNPNKAVTDEKARAAKQPRVVGPSLPPPEMMAQMTQPTIPIMPDDDSDDDELGPLPLHQAKRKQLPNVVPRKNPALDSKREEWMMVPGEHDLLKGITSSGAVLKNRTFANTKSRVKEETMDPRMLQEISAIKELHAQHRGPSLLDQHLQSQQESKTRTKKEWKWNRDDDLEEGRRVDKHALHMVYGGAKSELNSKFQGGYNRG